MTEKTFEQLIDRIKRLREQSRMNKAEAVAQCNYSEAAVWKAWENCCRMLLDWEGEDEREELQQGG